ncbi:RNA-directed DNA polymerase, eukaryota [Tanacetum coccineum]
MSYKITSLSLAFLCVSATCLDVPEELASRTSERAYYLEARHIRYLRMLRKKKSRLGMSLIPYPCARCGLVVDTGEDGITSLLISFNATINNMEGGDSQKSELNKVLENGPWLIRMVPIILNGWTPNNKPKTEEITSAPGRITYSRALIEVSSEQALLETLVVVIGHTMETIDIEYEWQPPQCETLPNEASTSTLKANGQEQLHAEQDNGKLMDGLVDNARKKVEALPKKTPRKIGIWSG